MGIELSPFEVMGKLDAAVLALQEGNKELKKYGVEMGEAKRKYAIALQKEMLKLKAEKVPVTIMLQIAKGNTKVAQLRFEKDIAETNYFCCLDAQNSLKMEIETLRSLLSFIKLDYINT